MDAIALAAEIARRKRDDVIERSIRSALCEPCYTAALIHGDAAKKTFCSACRALLIQPTD